MRIPGDEITSQIQNVDRKHTYTVWGIPPDPVVERIKKLMEPLQAEFSGPEIEPHITVVGSVRWKHDEMIKQFLRGCEYIEPYPCKVDQLVTLKFYYQPVSLLFHPAEWRNDISDDVLNLITYLSKLDTSVVISDAVIHMPHMSLLYGDLIEEERKRALEKVTELDDSITSLNFTTTRQVLCKTHNEARDQHSWEKVMEYNLR